MIDLLTFAAKVKDSDGRWTEAWSLRVYEDAATALLSLLDRGVPEGFLETLSEVAESVFSQLPSYLRFDSTAEEYEKAQKVLSKGAFAAIEPHLIVVDRKMTR